MAKIDVQRNDGVSLSGASFVDPGFVEQNPGLEFKQLETVAEAGIDIFTAAKKSQAASASKSLLEEFTGYEAERDILAQEDEVLAQEAHERDILANAHPGSAQRDISTNQLAVIERTKDQLNRDRAAVDQGKLSLEEFRRRAEGLFYQQVVNTPGLKSEIAAVMSEYLGIDPRGQTAQIEMENRKAAAKAAASEKAWFKKEMIKGKYWVRDKSDEWNFTMLGQQFLDDGFKMKKLEQQSKLLEFNENLNEREREVKARQTMNILTSLQTNALNDLSKVGDFNVYEFGYQELFQMSEEDRGAMMNIVAEKAQNFINILNIHAAKNDKLGDKVNPLIQSIEGQRDQILSVLSLEEQQSIVEQKLQMLSDQNKIRVQARINDLQLTEPDVLFIQSMGEIAGTENLTGSIIQERLMLLSRGQIQDLNGVSSEEREDTLSLYQTLLQKASNALTAQQELTDPQKEHMFKALKGMSRHYADELDSPTRQQLFRLAANQDFMKEFEQRDERGYRNFMSSAMNNQMVELGSLTSTMQNRGSDPSEYYLKKEDDTWIITPTTLAIEKQAQGKLRGRTGIGRDPDPAEAERKLRDSVHQVNNTRGLIGNMIKSRMIALSISEAEAARQVANVLGMNFSDVKKLVEEEKSGFAEEAGVE